MAPRGGPAQAEGSRGHAGPGTSGWRCARRPPDSRAAAPGPGRGDGRAAGAPGGASSAGTHQARQRGVRRSRRPRFHAVVPPLSLCGPVVTLRKFGIVALGPDELVRLGSIEPEIMDFLGAAVRGRANILVSGGAASGKTTLLGALSSFIPVGERIVTIEDAAELRLAQPHVVRLEARPPNVEGLGAVTVRDLVRNALRMRPDRIIV